MDKVYFKNKKGVKLCGVLLKPKDKCPVVIFAHGYGSSKDSSRNRAIADELMKKGIGAFLFDFSGHGDSEGIIGEDVVAQQAEDLKAAIDFVKADKIGVNGSSLGGTVAIVVASRDKRISAMVLRSPPSAEVYNYADKVVCPVLVVQGEGDVEILEQNKVLVKHLKNGKLEIIKGASHLYEDPKHLREMVLASVKFLVRNL